MKLIPRDYQNEAVYSIFRYFDKYKAKAGNPIVVLPTGTGKSLVIAEFFRLLLEWYPNQKVMMLTHVKELIGQNFEKMMNIWPEAPAGIYSAGLKRRDVHHQIIFAGIGSVSKKAEQFGNISIVLVDECHLISPDEKTMYQKFFKALREINPYLKIVGLTATPYRLGFGPIYKIDGDEEAGVSTIFDDVVFDGSSAEFFNWFIKEGYLVPLIPKRTKMQLDVAGVKKQGGDYVLGELQTAVNKAEANAAAVAESLEWGEHRRAWLIFCSGVQHAKDVAAEYRNNGISCEAVYSDMGDAERDRVLLDFKAGRLKAVTNFGVLTTGFDYTAIDLIVMLRPTQSTILWVQMLGRGTRPDYAPGYDISDREQRLLAIQESEKHDCLVLDFSGNSRKIGPINDPNIPRRPGSKGPGPGIFKECEICGLDGQYPAWRFCGGKEHIDITGYSYDQVTDLVNQGYNIQGNKAIGAYGSCGAPFKFKEKLKKSASTEVIIKETLPIIEDFQVLDIVYQKNVNRAHPEKPPTLKVTYHCGHKIFTEYVCLMHSAWAGRKAYNWWKNRTTLPLPQDIDDALDIISSLKIPTHIKVHTNAKYPEILNCCYDGTCFGTIAPVQTDIGVQVYTKDSIMSNRSYVNPYDEDDAAHLNTKQTFNLTPASNVPSDEDIPF